MGSIDRPLDSILRLSLHPEEVAESDNYRIAGIYSFGRGFIERPAIRGMDTSYPRLFKIKEGQLVMSKLGAWEGAFAVVPQEFDGAYVSPEYPSFDIDSSTAEPRYVANLARWPGFWDRVNPRGSMARRKRITPAALMKIRVPLPDLPEQRRIATRLDSALSELAKVQELRGRRARLMAAHQESLVSTVSAAATEMEALGQLLRPARSPIDIDELTQYRAIGMRSFGRGIIRYPEASGGDLSKLRYFTFPANALALSNIKAWEGAIGVTEAEDTACVASNRFLFYVGADDRINVRYLRYYLLSRQGLAQISSCSPGSADRNRTLSIKSFERISVPLPPRPEQDRVASLLDALTKNLDSDRTDAVVQSLRPSLLNAAFSGDLR